MCLLRRPASPEQSGPPCRHKLPIMPRTSSQRWLKKRPLRPCRRVSTSASSLSGWEGYIQNLNRIMFSSFIIGEIFSICTKALSHPSFVLFVFLLLICPFVSCLQNIYVFFFRVWICHCLKVRMRLPSSTSCFPTLLTVEMCSNWRKDKEQLSATEEWVRNFKPVLDVV